jgi:hypothetical protein
MHGIHTHIFPRQTMSLGDTLLHLFCLCCFWCLYFYFLRWLFCSFTLALPAVRVQCPIWQFSVVPERHGFLVCRSRICWMIWKWFLSSHYYWYHPCFYIPHIITIIIITITLTMYKHISIVSICFSRHCIIFSMESSWTLHTFQYTLCCSLPHPVFLCTYKISYLLINAFCVHKLWRNAECLWT